VSSVALKHDLTGTPLAWRRKGLVTERYPAMATELLNPLLDLLGRSREACGGDMDTFLVMLVILVRTAQHPEFKKLSHQQLLSGEVPVFPSLRTNVRSVAASIGIPRESVRRKVTQLIGRGWVMRADGDLFITAEAYRQLVPVHEGLERLAIRYFEAVAACLDNR
jgi:hypothetical protein